MPIVYRPTCAEIDLAALRFNIGEIKKKVPSDFPLLAIVKANAYGHGALFCTRTLEGAGVHSFGVATVEEGMELRREGIRSEIVVLGGMLGSSPELFLEYRLKPVIHQFEDLHRFGNYLKQNSKEYEAHLKLDTGMGRLGFLPSDTELLIEFVKKHPELKIAGVMTHLARADEEDPEPTRSQYLLFERLRKVFENKGFNAPCYHIANSAALIEGKIDSTGLARPGIILYGAYPHPRHREMVPLKPVMKLKTEVAALKKYLSGAPLGYGGTFVTKRESVIGILPIGYADGLPRLVSNQGVVLVRGIRAPIVGRVSMDLTLVDLTDIPNAQIGDEAVLIGEQGGEIIRAEEVALWAQTISYEIFCGISSRVPRIYRGM